MPEVPSSNFNAKLSALIETLIDLLKNIDSFGAEQTRNTLIQGLPGIETIDRSKVTITDLQNIVRFAITDNSELRSSFRERVIRYVPETLMVRPQVDKCFDAIENLFRDSSGDASYGEESVSVPEPDIDIPFTNRESELKLILTDRSPAHHIIDGPVGFGKSKMLEELESIFTSKEQNYICARVSVKDNPTMIGLLAALCNKFDFGEVAKASILGADGDVQRISVRFGQEIIRNHFPTSKDSYEQKGVVILIDDVGSQFAEVSRDLLEIFIPMVAETLREGNEAIFSESNNSFRVIFAGRYLAQFVSSLVPKLPWELKPIVLKPFDYKVVWDTARKVLKKRKNVEQTSAHILHMTGGHPHCLAEVLKFNRDHPAEPETFFRHYSERIWNEVVRLQINALRNSIPHHLLTICERLSVFRVFNSRILKQLMETNAFFYDKDEFSLQVELGETYLYDTSPSRYIGDSIVRRMLVMHLRKSDKASNFPEFCDEAYNLCQSLIEDSSGVERDMWTVECLYQALQKHVDSIDNLDQRIQLRKTYMEDVVPEVIETFVLGSKRHEPNFGALDPQIVNQELSALIREINDDRNWDFRFTFNYFLRAEHYNEDLFSQLVETVRNWRK